MRSTEERLASLEKEAMIQHALNLALMQLLTLIWREDLRRDTPELAQAKIQRYREIVGELDFVAQAPSHAHPVEADFVSAHTKETMEKFFERLAKM